ncbi:hypothetical protein Bca52824_004117 [Brassica carinata]|uniref:Uncharacterized protein n=1 Tax=Brassica carinata TaxID=52824 RepID=A0A8X8BGF0_BRACI|nr:hypothetical protein Bca52824_004117 [Brassica carinata]
MLLSRSAEIHLVSRVNIVGSRAAPFLWMGLFMMRLCMAITLEFSSLGVFSDTSTMLVRAITGNFQSKEIIGFRSISSDFAPISFSLLSRLEYGLAYVALQAHLSML